MRPRHGQYMLRLATLLCGGVLISGAFAQEAAPAGDDATAEAPAPFLRISEKKSKFIALDIASRDYVPRDGEGPQITLMGVSHIGERSFYRSLQQQLSNYDLVLYESVLPAGANGADGQTDPERIESTQAVLGFVGSVIETYRSVKDRYPADMESLETFANERDARLGQWMRRALTDGWGNPLEYRIGEEAMTYSLKSFGADGAAGGEGADADLDLKDQPRPEPLGMGGDDDNIQAQLADALSLEFQLFALNYDQDNWRCSDMAMDEVDRALDERGVEFELVSGALEGTSLFAKFAKVFLGMIRFADVLLDGAIADMFKVVLIEMLSDETMMQAGLSQFGEGFQEVIVEMRNQVVIDDLKTLIGRERDVKSVAVLYGAAHMDDMARRLDDQLDYEPSDETWHRAIEVDLEHSVVPERELRQMRTMMKQAMRMQMQQP